MVLKQHAVLLCTASLIGLTTPAFAQDAAPAAATAAPANPDDIIVTATRRAERLQDVPVAVSALNGGQLAKAGFKSLADIQYQFSGVQFGTSPNDAGFRLRGVGSAGGFTSASEQNVGTVVDNVVIPFGNPIESLGDLDRIEVLKGPQGTQFGKNSSSGVVNITTKRPDLDKFGGSLFASYGELNEHDVHGSINAPLSKTAALSVYAFHRGYDGFIDNIVLNKKWGGSKSYGTRAKLLWEPSDTFSAYLIGDYSKRTQTGPGQLWTLNRLPSFSNPLMAARFGPILALGVTPGFGNTTSVENTDGSTAQKNYGGSLEMNLALGDYSLTSITAYRRLDISPFTYGLDATNLPIFTARENGTDRSFGSQEIRLTSPKGERLEYVAGVYASRNKSGLGDDFASAQLRPALPFDPVQVSITNGLSRTYTKSDSAAVFVDGSFRLAEKLRLLGGARYSYDWVRASSYSSLDPLYPPAVGPNGFTVPYGPRALQTGEINKGNWSGRAGLEYKPSSDLLFFGTVARGYLGPTVTFSGLSGTRTEVKPQTVRDITIGVKSQLFDHKLTLNGNIFFDKYKNLQTSVFNGQEFLTQNAGGFEAKGFEADATFRFSRRFSINSSITYSDTKFTDYVTACPNSVLAAGATAIAATCNAPGSTTATPLYQAKGQPLSGAPKFALTSGANFNQPIGDHYLLDASANYYRRSKVHYDVGDTLSVQKGYQIVGANLGFGRADGQWRVAVFARNLFDKRFQSSIIGLPFADPGGLVNWNTRDGRRTIGGSAEIRF